MKRGLAVNECLSITQGRKFSRMGDYNEFANANETRQTRNAFGDADVSLLEPGDIRLVMQDDVVITSVATLLKAPVESILRNVAERVFHQNDVRGHFSIDRKVECFDQILSYLKYGKIPEEVSTNEDLREKLLAEARYYNIKNLIKLIHEINGGGQEVSLETSLPPLLCGQIRLIIGERMFETSVMTLQNACLDSKLWKIGKLYENTDNQSGMYFIDRKPDFFKHVLEYIRYGTVPRAAIRNDFQLCEALLQEARFYGEPGMVQEIQRCIESND